MYKGVQYKGWGFCVLNYLVMAILLVVLFLERNEHASEYGLSEEETINEQNDLNDRDDD